MNNRHRRVAKLKEQKYMKMSDTAKCAHNLIKAMNQFGESANAMGDSIKNVWEFMQGK